MVCLTEVSFVPNALEGVQRCRSEDLVTLVKNPDTFWLVAHLPCYELEYTLQPFVLQGSMRWEPVLRQLS